MRIHLLLLPAEIVFDVLALLKASSFESQPRQSSWLLQEALSGEISDEGQDHLAGEEPTGISRQPFPRFGDL